MAEQRFNKGDRIFFFNEFPIKYSDFNNQSDIFYEFDDGIQFIHAPSRHRHEICHNLEDENIYDAVFPLEKLPGIGKCHFAIKIPNSIKEPELKFWNILLGFRLIKPLKISIAGMIEFDEKEDRFKNFSLINIYTLINAGNPNVISDEQRYSFKDMEEVQKLEKGISFFIQNKNAFQRVSESIASFKGAMFSRAAYRMIYKELFSCLEALFHSPGAGKILAGRVSNFLKDFHGIHEIMNFIENEYKTKRHSYTHGDPGIPLRNLAGIEVNHPIPFYEDILKLQEITRLCLLGFLEKDLPFLENHEKIKGSKKGAYYKNDIIGAVSLTNKKLWNQHPYQHI